MQPPVENLAAEFRREAAAMWSALGELADIVGVDGARFITAVDTQGGGHSATALRSPPHGESPPCSGPLPAAQAMVEGAFVQAEEAAPEALVEEPVIEASQLGRLVLELNDRLDKCEEGLRQLWEDASAHGRESRQDGGGLSRIKPQHAELEQTEQQRDQPPKPLMQHLAAAEGPVDLFMEQPSSSNNACQRTSACPASEDLDFAAMGTPRNSALASEEVSTSSCSVRMVVASLEQAAAAARAVAAPLPTPHGERRPSPCKAVPAECPLPQEAVAAQQRMAVTPPSPCRKMAPPSPLSSAERRPAEWPPPPEAVAIKQPAVATELLPCTEQQPPSPPPGAERQVAQWPPSPETAATQKHTAANLPMPCGERTPPSPPSAAERPRVERPPPSEAAAARQPTAATLRNAHSEQLQVATGQRLPPPAEQQPEATTQLPAPSASTPRGQQPSPAAASMPRQRVGRRSGGQASSTATSDPSNGKASHAGSESRTPRRILSSFGPQLAEGPRHD